jgi:hypothetical protein
VIRFLSTSKKRPLNLAEMQSSNCVFSTTVSMEGDVPGAIELREQKSLCNLRSAEFHFQVLCRWRLASIEDNQRCFSLHSVLDVV